MVDPLDRDTFKTLIGEIGVSNDRVVHATRPERRAYLVRHRRRFLTATSAGRTRLRLWLDGDLGLPPMSRGELAAHVRYRLTLYGDTWHLPIVVDGLLQAPEPVRQFVLASATFVSVGRDSRAWTSSALLVDRDGPKRRVVMLGPDVDPAVVVHECFHVWHSALPRDGATTPAVSAVGASQLYQLATDQGWSHRIDAHGRFHERLAEGAAVAYAV